MKRTITFLAVILLCLFPLASRAGLPGAHPGIEHMLTDLRAARWNIVQRGGENAAVSNRINIVLAEIDASIAGVSGIAVDEGLKLPVPSLKTTVSLPGRVQQAAYLLGKAEHDLSGEVDRPETRAQRAQIKAHIDAAKGFANQLASAVASNH